MGCKESNQTNKQRVAGSRLTEGAVLCPWSGHFILCLVLVQPRKTRIIIPTFYLFLFLMSQSTSFQSCGGSSIWVEPVPGLPRSGKKFWKMKKNPGQGKVKELHFQSGKFKNNEKSHGKVREFQNFPKKMLVNRFLEILVSIICKQY